MNFEDFIKDKHIEMKSNEFCEIINKLRIEEGKTIKEHKTLLRDIRKEIKTLESLKLRDQYKFVLVEYVDVKGESKVRHNNFKSKIETELKTLQSLNPRVC